MPTRILLLLGETSSCASARAFAFRLAHRSGAALAGLAGVDLQYIEAPMPGRAGTIAIKAETEARMKARAEETRARLRAMFEAETKDESLAFEWLSFDGDPMAALMQAVESVDLVVAGHDAAFRGGTRESLSDTMGALIATTPRPVVVCPDEDRDATGVLVAYDGSLPAMRALQLFALLGLGKGRKVHVASVDRDEAEANRRATAATAFLRARGHDAESLPLATKAEPGEVLRIETRDRAVGLMVMGAYGHRGWKAALFGSTTGGLVENPPCPLFVYH